MKEYSRKPYLRDDYFTMRMFSPIGVEWLKTSKPYYDDNYLSEIDYTGYQLKYPLMPSFDLVNQSIQDPYIDGFIPLSTNAFTQLGGDKTGVLGKIGYDDEIKKTDEREGELEDPVTGHPILVVQSGENTEFTVTENNQSGDKYNWIAKESGTVSPTYGGRTTFTAPSAAPEEPVKLYLFNKQHQLDYMQIEIESSGVNLYVAVSLEGYDTYGFVWNVANGTFEKEIKKDVEVIGETVGNDLFIVEQKSTSYIFCGCQITDYAESETGCEGGGYKCTGANPCVCDGDPACDGQQCTCSYYSFGTCSASDPSVASCPGINNELLTNYRSAFNQDIYESWSLYECGQGQFWWQFWFIDGDVYHSIVYNSESIIENYAKYFDSFKLTALNDSGYIGSARTHVEAKSSTISSLKYTLITPIGALEEIETESVRSPGKYLYKQSSNIGHQFSDKCVSQGYILQYILREGTNIYDREIKVIAQASTVEDGNKQTPLGLERTTDLEMAIQTLVGTWYSGNGFGSTDIEDLTITWELIQ